MAHPDHEALLDLAQAMRRYFPHDPYTWLYLGYADYRLGDLQQAEAHFQLARQYIPDSLNAVFEDFSRLQLSRLRVWRLPVRFRQSGQLWGGNRSVFQCQDSPVERVSALQSLRQRDGRARGSDLD